MDSFQANIGRKRPRKTENKSYRSVSFGTKQKIKKNIAKKFKKLKNTITGSFEAKLGRKRPRKTKNKNYRFVRSCPALNRKFKENSKKIQIIKKHHYGFISRKRRFEKDVKQ